MLNELHAKLQNQQKRLENSLLAFGLAGSLSLLVCLASGDRVSPSAKTSLLTLSFSSFSVGSLLTLLKGSRKQSHLAQLVVKAQEVQDKKSMQYELALATSQIEIDKRLQLFQSILSLPDELQSVFADQFGVGDLYFAMYGSIYPQMEDRSESVAIAPGSVAIALPPTKPNDKSNPWLVEIVAGMLCSDPDKRSWHHLMVNGATQQGKSTLVKKIIELIIKGSQHLGSQTTICLVDPKYPLSRWGIKASYTGHGMVSHGLSAAIAEMERRKEEYRTAIVSGLDEPKFGKYVFILDEWSNAYGEGKGYPNVTDKKTAESSLGKLKALVQEGSALDIIVIVIGQSPLSEATGFSRSDLSNVGQIIVGGKLALSWIDDPKFQFKSDKEVLRSEIEDHLADNKRCCLLMNNMGNPEVVTFNKPTVDLPNLGGDIIIDYNDDADPPMADSSTSYDPPMGAGDRSTSYDSKIKGRDVAASANDANKLYSELKRWYLSYLSVNKSEPSDDELNDIYLSLSGSEDPLSIEGIRYLKDWFKK